MEFGIEKCALMLMKNGKEIQRKEQKYQITKEKERLEIKKNLALNQKSYQRNKQLGYSCKILGTILRTDNAGTQTNGPNYGETTTYVQGLTQERYNMCQENKEDFHLTWRFTWMHQNKVSSNA